MNVDRLAKALSEHLVGRPDAYALQQSDGTYVAVRKPISLDLLQRHVLGKCTVAGYVVSADGTARCGAYDFDKYDHVVQESCLWLKRWFAHWGIELLIENSGRKGLHAWVIAKNQIPAQKMQRLLQTALRALEEETGVALTAEVNPKQAKVIDLGSAMKLPWGIHRVSDKRTSFLDDNFEPLPDLGLSLVEGLPAIPECLIDEILSECPGFEAQVNPRTLGNSRAEIVQMLTRPLLPGERRPTLIRLAGYLRYRGVHEEVAVALLMPWARAQFADGLAHEEIEKHITGIYSRYGTRLPTEVARLVDEIPHELEEMWK